MSISQSYNEKELLLQIAEGDEKAFENLFYTYFPEIHPLITSIVKNETATKDVIQDIFLNIWINRNKLPEIENLRSWIFTLAYNQSYSWLRKKDRQDNKISTYTDKMQHSGAESAVEEYSAFRELGKLIQSAISEKLSPQQRKIYLLSREHHLTIPQIAAALDLSPNTVKNTLVAALKIIREFLKKKGILLPLVLLSFVLS